MDATGVDLKDEHALSEFSHLDIGANTHFIPLVEAPDITSSTTRLPTVSTQGHVYSGWNDIREAGQREATGESSWKVTHVGSHPHIGSHPVKCVNVLEATWKHFRHSVMLEVTWEVEPTWEATASRQTAQAVPSNYKVQSTWVKTTFTMPKMGMFWWELVIMLLL